MRAVVMAGGEGTRLRPLTSNQPKPMVPVANKPCMEHIIELLLRHGIEDIVVTLAFLPKAIRDYFGDGSALGANINYSVEQVPLGTAGSVKNAEELLGERFIVISGDALTDFDLTAVDRRARASRSHGHDRPEARREPPRVRRGRDQRRGSRRALPRKADLGTGVLRHGQHRHLRARARGLQLHPRRTVVRLQSGAVSQAVRARQAALRHGRRRLLAGHRQPRAVPRRQSRRARRQGAGLDTGHPPREQHLHRRERQHRVARARDGTGGDRQLRQDRPERAHRRLHGDGQQRGRQGPRRDALLRDRRQHLHRLRHEGLRRHPRQELRRQARRDHQRGRRHRRRVRDRRAGLHRSRRQDLPVQDRRIGRSDQLEHHLGVARHGAALRQGRRRRADQRRHHRGARPQAGDGLRHDAAEGRQGGHQPRRPPRLAGHQARHHQRPELHRRRRPRPAGQLGGRQPLRDQERQRAGRRPRADLELGPRGHPDPGVRAARHPRQREDPEEHREVLRPPGLSARLLHRDGAHPLSRPGGRDVHARPHQVVGHGAHPRRAAIAW